MTDYEAAILIANILAENGFDAPIVGELGQIEKIYNAIVKLLEQVKE